MGFVDGAHTVETNTSLSQNTTTGVITYTNEASSPQTANVVSSDANNSIKIGLDGGAYFGAYEKIVIWAEENSSLANNQLEWSFGNGATGLIGIPLPKLGKPMQLALMPTLTVRQILYLWPL